MDAEHDTLPYRRTHIAQIDTTPDVRIYLFPLFGDDEVFGNFIVEIERIKN